MTIYDISLKKLLPEFLRLDPSGAAMADALTPELRELAGQARYALIFPRLGELSEAILDELARELDVAWYIPDASVQAKRAIIRDAYKVHAKIGTPWAVETIARRYFGDAVVMEWWEYGAQPYHFQVRTGSIAEGTREAENFARIVARTKNARSVLDGVVVEAALPFAGVYAASHLQCARVIHMEVAP